MTQPLFQHIYLSENQSYNILFVNRTHFIVPWHFHPEIEIMLVLEGEGSRIVGDSIENYSAGDLVIVGSNLPHCWKSGASHYHQTAESPALSKAQVILFRPDAFGADFFNLPELHEIQKLLTKAGRGIKFTGTTQQQVSAEIREAYTLSGAKRFAAFIAILNKLAESTEYELLSTEKYLPAMIDHDMQRMNQILDYLLDNFQKPISLEQVSSLACMSPTSFCRYFKARTNKTFVGFLNELRIGFAKKLIIASNKNIADISDECGFHNVSNFYEQFNKIAKCSPNQFKKRSQMQMAEFIKL